MGYINEGQKPFESPENIPQCRFSKKEFRNAERKYKKLGMHVVTKKKCKFCGRILFLGHVCDRTPSQTITPQIPCPKCGTIVLSDASYCYNCGKRLQHE